MKRRTLRQQVRRWAWVAYFAWHLVPQELAWAMRTNAAMWREVRRARRQAAEQPPAAPTGRSCGGRELIPAKRAAGWRWRRLSYLVRVGWPTVIKAKVTLWALQARTGFAWGKRYMETRARLRHGWREGLERQIEAMGTNRTDGTGGVN